MDETNRDASQCGRGVSQFMLDDLQLAAELGKTLLERNKELEIFLKEYKCKGDEQEREIVHLRKHINAMTEVNDSRLKVYEQLEVGIQDLERANQRLIIEKNSDKKQIKTISSNTEILESRCEELSQLLNESKQALSIERRKSDRLQQELNSSMPLTDKKIGDHSDQRNKKFLDFNCRAADHHLFEHRNIANSTGVDDRSPTNDSLSLVVVNNMCDKGAVKCEDNEVLVKLISDLELMKRELLTEQKRCAELEEQLMAIIQENQGLQTRLTQNNANEKMMSMHDEFSLLDDVRQGQMCSRCLGVIDGRTENIDEQSSVDQIEDIYEDDEPNMNNVENQSDIELVTNHISHFANCTPGCSYKIDSLLI
ncbi:cerebellar degeneration-related protein 2 isoform X5 [Drosophila miranda]|uniref:cerebellar degeneration-related protein 2 isoform X5 n=1 Tax=Drosophila miranda TaxID=7229 RepID=UPI00143F7B32|nr:cerebellar degeneration-related protein 2 isoform X5 [Drosophila miranda]